MVATSAAGIRSFLAVALFCCILGLTMWRLAGKMIDPVDPQGSQNQGRNGLADFRDVIYYPTRAVAEGVNPYDAGLDPLPDGSARYRNRYPVYNLFPLYSPLVLLLFGLLSLPDFYTGAFAFQGLNVLLLLAWSYCIWKTAEQIPTVARVFGLATLMLISQSGRAIFIGGETALLLAIGTLLAVVYTRKQPSKAGWAIALSSLKPTFGIPLGLLLLCRREVKTVAIGWSISAAIGVVGLWFIFSRSGDLHRLPEIILENQRVLESDPDASALTTAIRIDSAAAIERWLTLRSPISRVLAFLAVLLLAGDALWRLSRWQQDREAEQLMRVITLVGTTAVMYRIMYDGVALWGGIGLLWLAPTSIWERTSPRLRWFLGGLLLVTQFNILPTEFVIRWLQRLQITASISPGVSQFAWTLACTLSGLALLLALAILNWHSRKWDGTSAYPAQ